MFSFFKKKKTTENNPISAPQEAKKVEQIVKELNTQSLNSPLAIAYNALLEKHRVNLPELETEAKQLIEADNYADTNVWMNALAICDVALEKQQLSDTIKELYRQINARSWNKHTGMALDDVDYHFWFELNKAINNRFIKAKVYRGWAEQADLYSTARSPYRDYDKMIALYLKGIEVNDAASHGDYGYGLYTGTPGFGKADKEEGLKHIQKSKELNYEIADLLLLYVDFYTNTDNEALLKNIEAYVAKAPQIRKAYYLLADYYIRKEDNFDKFIEITQQGVAIDDHYCEYILGMNMLNGRIENADKAEAIRLLENAFSYRMLYAGNFLGQYYRYANDENTSIEKSIEWHEKAALYYSSESMYELALIYLYEDSYKDWNKGMHYLDLAIAEGNTRAMGEKAFLLLESTEIERKPEEAKILLEQALELGNDYAPYRLALAYQNAEFGGEVDYAKALELYEIAAERGNIYGIEMAGNYYRIGVVNDDEPNNAPKAIEYLSRGVEMGSNYARVELGLCYEVGYGVEKDYQKAFDLYQLAANNNYPYANQKMAYYYEDGLIGESEDLTKALENFKIAADAEIPNAVYNVGRYYKYAVGIPENPEEAMNYFNKAAQMGNAEGLVEVALAYEQGYAGLEFDAQKTMDYMLQAAEAGYTYAQYKIGYYHYYGLQEVDMEKGLEWFRKAYAQGYPYAAIMLGEYYLYNHAGGEPEYEKAIEYFQFAQERDIITEGLGVCYEYGLGVEENLSEAFKYYTLAAEKGNVTATYRLGICYKYGIGTTINMTEAFECLSEAAEDEHLSAMYNLGMMYLNGEGTAQDEQKGAELLLKAAEADNSDAQLEIGNCYLTGKGVSEDEVQAMVWYQKAADNGNEQAQKLTGKRERRRR